jgi:hypothetical protein
MAAAHSGTSHLPIHMQVKALYHLFADAVRATPRGGMILKYAIMTRIEEIKRLVNRDLSDE